MDAEKNKFLEECQQLELQRNKLKTCKRNIQDQELLDQGRFVSDYNLLIFYYAISYLYHALILIRFCFLSFFCNYRRKYALYRELTGIRWDFEKLKENITGSILLTYKIPAI